MWPVFIGQKKKKLSFPQKAASFFLNREKYLGSSMYN